MENNVQQTTASKPLPSPLPNTTRRDYVYFMLALLFSLLTANGVFGGAYQLIFSLGTLALLVTAMLYLGKPVCKSPLGIISLVTSFIIILSFAIHENTSFAFFKFIFLILSISLFIVSSYGIKTPNLSDFRALLSPFYLLFGINIGAASMTARALASKNAPTGKKIAKILLSLLITMPLLLVIAVLLIYADSAFEGFIDKINFDAGELLATLFVGAILLVCIFPMLFAIAKKEVKQAGTEKKPYLSALDSIFVNTFLSAVSLLYLLFLVTQLSYLGGGFMGLLPKDYTYSAYARRGFFEMCLICIINLGIIFLGEFFVKRVEEKLPRITRILNTFISIFSIFLIATAISKMFMYIRTYGLTFLRLGTSIFMLLLFFAFGCTVIKAFATNFFAMQTVLAAACIIMSLTAAIEPYNIIAKYNLYAYESGMHDEFELDTNYFAYSCGAYGTEALITLAGDENAFVSSRAKEQLENIHKRYYHSIGNTELREMSLARHIANQKLQEYYSE